MLSICSWVLADHPPARNTRATRFVSEKGRESRHHRLLCANRIGPWIQCPRIGNDCNLVSRRQGIYSQFASIDGVQMVDWHAGTNGKPRHCHGATYYRWKKSWTASFHLSNPRPHHSRAARGSVCRRRRSQNGIQVSAKHSGLEPTLSSFVLGSCL